MQPTKSDLTIGRRVSPEVSATAMAAANGEPPSSTAPSLVVNGIALYPERMYSPIEYARVRGGRSLATLATERCRGTGIAYHRVGRCVYYAGRDIINELHAGRVLAASAL